MAKYSIPLVESVSDLSHQRYQTDQILWLVLCRAYRHSIFAEHLSASVTIRLWESFLSIGFTILGRPDTMVLGRYRRGRNRKSSNSSCASIDMLYHE